MSMSLRYPILALLCLALLILGLYVLISSRKITEYGPLKLGETAPFKPGDQTSYPYRTIQQSRFYVYVVQKGLPTDCVFEECGMSGVLVDCMGGWLSGDEQAETAERFGLDIEKVRAGKSSMVVVADKDSKIVGMYPNRTTHNLPTILQKHPELSDSLETCFDFHLPHWP